MAIFGEIPPDRRNVMTHPPTRCAFVFFSYEDEIHFFFGTQTSYWTVYGIIARTSSSTSVLSNMEKHNARAMPSSDTIFSTSTQYALESNTKRRFHGPPSCSIQYRAHLHRLLMVEHIAYLYVQFGHVIVAIFAFDILPYWPSLTHCAVCAHSCTHM